MPKRRRFRTTDVRAGGDLDSASVTDDAYVRRVSEAFRRIGLIGTEPQNLGETRENALERIARLNRRRANLVGVLDNSSIFRQD